MSERAVSRRTKRARHSLSCEAITEGGNHPCDCGADRTTRQRIVAFYRINRGWGLGRAAAAWDAVKTERQVRNAE